MLRKKHTSQRLNTSVIAVACVLTLSLSLLSQYAINCASVRDGVLRLHVIANSDSPADQDIKLTVRDTVLECGSEIFDGSVTSEAAVSRITPELQTIKAAAETVLADNGFSYGADAYISEEYFDTRAYGDITLPAGKYTALKIVLGDGAGKNWWCVMFPPLCLPAATVGDDSVYNVFSGEGAQVVDSEPEYEIRFGIVELFEKILAFFKR